MYNMDFYVISHLIICEPIDRFMNNDTNFYTCVYVCLLVDFFPGHEQLGARCVNTNALIHVLLEVTSCVTQQVTHTRTHRHTRLLS